MLALITAFVAFDKCFLEASIWHDGDPDIWPRKESWDRLQAFAISGKAADVRGVVRSLNERRQAEEQARDEQLLQKEEAGLSEPEAEAEAEHAEQGMAWKEFLDKVMALAHL